MSRVALLLSLSLAACVLFAQPSRDAPTTFGVLDVYIDSSEPLAAWQFEMREAQGTMQIAGIEGGAHASFAEPPYYDRTAVAAGNVGHIVVADFSLAPATELPVGRTRIASVHVRLLGTTAPDYELQLVAAGAADGRRIDATLSFDLRTGR